MIITSVCQQALFESLTGHLLLLTWPWNLYFKVLLDVANYASLLTSLWNRSHAKLMQELTKLTFLMRWKWEHVGTFILYRGCLSWLSWYLEYLLNCRLKRSNDLWINFLNLFIWAIIIHVTYRPKIDESQAQSYPWDFCFVFRCDSERNISVI